MKKSAWIWLIPLFLLSSAHAEGIKNVRDTYRDFSKGLNVKRSPLSLPKTQGDICDNVRFDRRVGAVSKRDEVYLHGTPGSTAINGLHRYYLTDGNKYLITALSTYLKYSTTGTFSCLKDSLSDSKRWQFVTYSDLLIGGNGYNSPIKWDGLVLVTTTTANSRSASALCAELGAPFSKRIAGTDLTASKWYSYKMGFSDGSTYYYPDTNSNTIQTGGTVCNLALTDVPLGDSYITSRYIYRTMACDTQAKAEATTVYYKATTLSDNTTVTWVDTVTDATLDNDAVPTWTTVSGGTLISPPLGNIVTPHDQRIFWAGNPSSPSYLSYSEPFNPDYYGPNNYEKIRPDDGDSITFLKVQLGTLTPGKENSIQKYYTDGSDPARDWALSDPFSFTGCAAFNSAVDSPLGIIYLSYDGIYVFNGYKSTLISDAVTPVIDDILKSNLDNCAGIFDDNKYYLAYTDRTLGGSTNDRILILDTIRNAYMKDTLNLNAFAVLNSADDTGILYSGTVDGKIYAHGTEDENLTHRYKSTFELGVQDDVRIYGTEDSPSLDLGWDCTIDTWLTELQTKDASISTTDSIVTYLSSAIVDRPDTDGQYTSPELQINANELSILRWNETLPSGTDITFAVRTGSTSTVDSTWSSWTSTEYSNPSNSDISSETADTYIQYRPSFSTDDIDYTSVISTIGTYTIRIAFSTSGTSTETVIPTKYRTGWTDLGYPDREKQLDTVKIYLTGTGGTLTFSYESYDGEVDDSFDIDLSTHNNYYEYSFDTLTIGEEFRFTFLDNGTTAYDIEKMVFKFNVLDEI